MPPNPLFLLALGFAVISSFGHLVLAFTTLAYTTASCSTRADATSVSLYDAAEAYHTPSRGHTFLARSLDDRRTMLRRGFTTEVDENVYAKRNLEAAGGTGRDGQGGGSWDPVGPPQVQVVSKCSVPYTVALTFVSVPYLDSRRRTDLQTFKDDGPSQYL
jgi:hypothetical protein